MNRISLRAAFVCAIIGFALFLLLFISLSNRPAGAASIKPSDVLDLKNWYITLPTHEKATPDTVRGLIGYENQPYFYAEGNAVVFRTPVDGAHTKNSKYPRTELREMTDGKLASWSTTSGVHTMEVTESINAIPVKKPEIVSAQLHDKSDDVALIHLSGNKLRVKYADGKKFADLDTDYKLGTVFTVKMEASNGQLKVWYNGQLKATIAAKSTGCYYKAGDYLQSNPSKGDSPKLMGEVRIYKLKVTHS